MGFVFLIMIFVGVFVPSNVYFLIISAIAAVLFSAYLLYDLQVRQRGLFTSGPLASLFQSQLVLTINDVVLNDLLSLHMAASVAVPRQQL